MLQLKNRDIAKAVITRLKGLRNLPKVDKFFETLMGSGHEWGIAGGFVRDSIFGHKSNDVDIIVDCKEDELESLFPGLPAARKINKFGGWKFCLDDVDFDVWTVRGSWGIKNGLVDYNSIASFLGCCTLSCDTIIVCPQTSRVLESGFKWTFEGGKLNLNFDEHPYPSWAAKRALKMAKKYDLGMSKELIKYIANNI